MERNKLLRADYLDIIFEGRNKSYGGYELRRKYATRARKACAAVVIGVAIAAAIPVIGSSYSSNEGIRHNDTTTVILNPPPIPPDKPIEELPLPTQSEPPAPAETIEYTVPEIAPDVDVTEVVKGIDDIKDKQIALTTGDGDGTIDPNLIVSKSGGGSNLVERTAPREELPLTIVEQMPQFEGNLEAYLRSNLRYPDDAREAGIEGRVGIQFVVNEDGSISLAEVLHKASPSLDAEALRVVRAMPKWKPGKQSGKPVKVYFKLPITFSLD